MRERVVLQLDLAAGRVLQASGFPSRDVPVNARPGVPISGRLHIGEWEFFFRATPYSIDGLRTCKVAPWLRGFSPDNIGPWAAKFDGAFSVIAWSRVRGVAYVAADRIGTHRLYVNVSDELLTITDHLLDQVRNQRKPGFDAAGTNVLLTFGYSLDPSNILANTVTIVLGRMATCSFGHCRVTRYFEPVSVLADPYETLDECIYAIDRAMHSAIDLLLADSVPLVMVSGGIDSLLLMKYVAEHTEGRFESMTFAVQGSERNELFEGSLAAQHFGSTHHELVVATERILEYATRSVVECDVMGYGGVELIALGDRLQEDGRPLTVFRGEDTRLHTPPIDGPTRLGLWAHLSGLYRRPVFRTGWELRRALRRWPFRRGRNYAKHILARTDLDADMESYIARCLLRFHDPTSSTVHADVPRPIAERLAALGPYTSIEQVARAGIIIAYDLQYTDDMRAIQLAIGNGNVALAMPFYLPGVVDTMARVPFALATKRKIVSPTRTRSPFPFVDKYVLRSLMQGSAPKELLYRRKSTAPALDVQIPIVFPGLIRPVLVHWGEGLIEALPEEVRTITRAFLEQTLAGGAGASTEYAAGVTGLRLLYLAALAWQMENPGGDLRSALADLRPAV